MSTTEERRRILKLIEDDAEADALSCDGLPLTGAVIGDRLGKVFAAINALARLQRELEAERSEAAANAAHHPIHSDTDDAGLEGR